MTMRTNTSRNPRSYRDRIARRRRLFAIGTLVVLIVGVIAQAIGAATARAHAGVVSISPASGSILTTAPKNVSITFNEGVEASAARVQILDANAKVVATTFSTNADRSSVTLAPAKTLPRGMYALRWSVTSADGHVVTGASTFAVGNRGKAGRAVTVTAKGRNGKSLTLRTTNGVGAKTFTFTGGGKVTGLELRHKRLGATLEIPVANGKASGVLPLPGEWTLTVIERVSTYVEERYSGKISLK